MSATEPSAAPEDALTELRVRLADFAARRDWDRFHTPKNPAMTLFAKAAELVAHFQWLTELQRQQLDADKLAKVATAEDYETGSRIADKLGVDLATAARDKIALNETRYPAEQVRGDARRAKDYNT